MLSREPELDSCLIGGKLLRTHIVFLGGRNRIDKVLLVHVKLARVVFAGMAKKIGPDLLGPVLGFRWATDQRLFGSRHDARHDATGLTRSAAQEVYESESN